MFKNVKLWGKSYSIYTLPPKISLVGLIGEGVYKFIRRIIYLFRPTLKALEEQSKLNAWWQRETEYRLQRIEKKLKFKGENDVR